MDNMNLKGIKPADEYIREEHERLKLNVSDEKYRELKDELGITEKEQRARALLKAEKAKMAIIEPEPERPNPPLLFNFDYPGME